MNYYKTCTVYLKYDYLEPLLRKFEMDEQKSWRTEECFLEFEKSFLENYTTMTKNLIVKYLQKLREHCDMRDVEYYIMKKIRNESAIKSGKYKEQALENRKMRSVIFKVFLSLHKDDPVYLCWGELALKSSHMEKENTTMKNVFSYNQDVNKTAYMNWRTSYRQPIQNMNVLADGYFQSAILLAKNCLDDNSDKKADAIIFPMLFSVNHGIELYEKSICWSMNILLGNSSKFSQNHDIRGLWYTTKSKIKEFGFGIGREEDEFNQMIKVLELYLDEISNTIKPEDGNKAYHNIDFSRYPLNNKNEYHFYLNRYDNVVIDLENFIEVFGNIHDCLKSLSGYYYELVVESWECEN